MLQAVRLKGRAGVAALADTLREDPVAVNHLVERLTETGLLAHDTILRLTGQGRTRLAELLAVERRHVDGESLTHAYNTFRNVNAELKAALVDWQLKAGEPNSHDDADYDAAVLARVDSVHRTVLPTLAAVAAQLPRLSGYSVKLQQALDRVKSGDTSWLTRPMADSYHTVWFELHEELIGAAGLTRQAEAERGHA